MEPEICDTGVLYSVTFCCEPCIGGKYVSVVFHDPCNAVDCCCCGLEAKNVKDSNNISLNSDFCKLILDKSCHKYDVQVTRHNDKLSTSFRKS